MWSQINDLRSSIVKSACSTICALSRALGDAFDVRRFHEQVLNTGDIPLPVLEAKIDAWIAGGGQ